jgi:hypothetical protein
MLSAPIEALLLIIGDVLMQPLVEFGDLVTGLQRLPEREKIILVALINDVERGETGEVPKIERMVAQTLISAACTQRRCASAESVPFGSNIARLRQVTSAPSIKTHSADTITEPVPAHQ